MSKRNQAVHGRPIALGLSVLVMLMVMLPILLAGCGEADDPTTPIDEPVVWRANKPNPFVGLLEAAVIERPTADRAWIEARWQGNADFDGGVLELVLPDAVLLVEGDAASTLGPDVAVGTARWLVEFRLDQDLDAVVRLGVETPQGRRSSDVALRLTPLADR